VRARGDGREERESPLEGEEEEEEEEAAAKVTVGSA